MKTKTQLHPAAAAQTVQLKKLKSLLRKLPLKMLLRLKASLLKVNPLKVRAKTVRLRKLRLKTLLRLKVTPQKANPLRARAKTAQLKKLRLRKLRLKKNLLKKHSSPKFLRSVSSPSTRCRYSSSSREAETDKQSMISGADFSEICTACFFIRG